MKLEMPGQKAMHPRFLQNAGSHCRYPQHRHPSLTDLKKQTKKFFEILVIFKSLKGL